MDRIAGELGLEMCESAILQKVEQLLKRHSDHSFSLEGAGGNNMSALSRKNKMLREELEGMSLCVRTFIHT